MRRRFFLLKKLQVWPRLQSEFADALLKARMHLPAAATCMQCPSWLHRHYTLHDLHFCLFMSARVHALQIAVQCALQLKDELKETEGIKHYQVSRSLADNTLWCICEGACLLVNLSSMKDRRYGPAWLCACAYHRLRTCLPARPSKPALSLAAACSVPRACAPCWRLLNRDTIMTLLCLQRGSPRRRF